MKNVTVRVSEKLNLDQCQKVLAAVLHKAGHPTCVSGLNIYFENLVDPADAFLIVEKGTQNLIEA